MVEEEEIPETEETRHMKSLDGESIAILKGRNYAALATINKDGSPQVTINAVDTDGRNVLINTSKGRIKVENTKRDRRVCVVVPDNVHTRRRVTVFGEVTEQITGEKAKKHINEISLRYEGREYPDRPNQVRVILVIRPRKVLYERVAGASYGKFVGDVGIS
jgi:PPOX class probable F420-dependent enzyme